MSSSSQVIRHKVSIVKVQTICTVGTFQLGNIYTKHCSQDLLKTWPFFLGKDKKPTKWNNLKNIDNFVTTNNLQVFHCKFLNNYFTVRTFQLSDIYLELLLESFKIW